MILTWRTKQRYNLFFVLLEVVFLVLICLPNLSCIFCFAPYLRSTENLQSNLLKDSGLFIDVAKYYACAQIASKNPENIWDLNAQQNWFKNYLHISPQVDLYATGKLSPAQYTPQSIFMFQPFARLSLPGAIIAFEVLSLLFMLIAVSILRAKFFKSSVWQYIVWWLIVLSAAPTTENFCYGQLNGILSGLAALFLLTWQSKNQFLAALSLALTVTIKPHKAFIMLIMALAAKKYRLLSLTLIFSLLFLGVTIFAFGFDSVLKYPQALFSIEQVIDAYKQLAPNTLIVSVLGPITILGGRSIARLISLPLLFICLAFIYFVWRKAISLGENAYPFAYAFTLLLFFVFGPHEHLYDLLLLSTAWAITIPPISIEKIYTLKSLPLRLWFLSFILFPVISWAIFLAGRHNPNAYFGSWHLPLLFLLLLVAGFNLVYQSKESVQDN